MTKAEKIFKDTHWACKKYIREWGVDDGAKGGFARLSTEEVTSTRTWNAIQNLIDKARRDIQIDFELNIMTESEVAKETVIIDMVQATLDNTRNRI